MLLSDNNSKHSVLEKAVIIPAQTGDIDFYWPLVSQFLNSALEHTYGETSLDGIRVDVENGKRQLWVIKKDDRYLAAVCTMIYTTETGIKIGEITIAGGSEHGLWDHFADTIGMWFQKQGCDYQDIVGRAGWHRLYKDRGFRLAYQQLRRPLTEQATHRDMDLRGQTDERRQGREKDDIDTNGIGSAIS